MKPTEEKKPHRRARELTTPGLSQGLWVRLSYLTLMYGLVLAPTGATAAPGVVFRCADLAGVDLAPEQIGLPSQGARIDSAAMMPATPTVNPDGDFCRITGAIKAVESTTPEIRFDLNLPTRWNGRALQIGGGGYNGVVVSGTGQMPFAPERAPIAEGYATFGDDSGHVGNSAFAEFGLVDEAVTNFGYAHLKKTHDAALALIKKAYGRAPEHMYFAGGSTGGREGYTVMQRFPDDYDGVIANSPALNFSGMRLIGEALGRAEYVPGSGFVPPALLEKVYRLSLEVCDKLDGAVDGIVSNVQACREREPEVIERLRCHGANATSHEADCLNDDQLATLVLMRDGLSLPYTLAWGVDHYPGYNVFQGTRLTGALGLARSAELMPPLSFRANGYLFTQGDGYLRFFVGQDQKFDALAFDVLHPGRFRPKLVALSETIGAMSPDLNRYLARGGKLITLQGLADEVVSPNQTIAYYEALVARYHPDTVDSFMRLYMVPGFQHGNGVFIPSVDLLSALDQWVTRGVAPQNLVATDVASSSNGRSRPLCRYPEYPRYLGTGDVDQAASFECAKP